LERNNFLPRLIEWNQFAIDMAFPDPPGNQVTVLRTEIDNGYGFPGPRRYSLYLGGKLLALKLPGDLKVSRDFDVIAGSYTVAFPLFIHGSVRITKYIIAWHSIL
jgi:hypothetical protein